MTINVLHTNAGCNWSGIENRIFIIAKLLKNSPRIRISIAADKNNPLFKKCRKENIEFFNFPIKNKLDIKAIFRLREIVKRNRFDILHTHRSTDHWIAVKGVNLFNLPVKIIRTRHNYTYLRPHLLNRFLYNKLTDKIIAVAEVIKNDLIEHSMIPPSKIVTIHSSLDIEKFIEVRTDKKRMRESLRIPSQIPVVGTVGRIREHKDYPNFLRASKIVKEKFPQIKFIIVGDGPLEGEMKKLAKNLGISENVLFLGKRDDIPQILSLFDIFVLSSSIEGSPAVIKEAMLLRKCVIATSVGGVPEIIENGVNGILVPPKEAVPLASEILRILRDKELAEELGRNAQKVILNKFTPLTMVSKTKEVYEELAGLK